MSDISESEFNRIFLKNLFREILKEKKIRTENLLDEMAGILADLFLREFNSGNLPVKILKEHKDIQKWLEDKIKNFNT